MTDCVAERSATEALSVSGRVMPNKRACDAHAMTVTIVATEAKGLVEPRDQGTSLATALACSLGATFRQQTVSSTSLTHVANIIEAVGAQLVLV